MADIKPFHLVIFPVNLWVFYPWRASSFHCFLRPDSWGGNDHLGLNLQNDCGEARERDNYVQSN